VTRTLTATITCDTCFAHLNMLGPDARMADMAAAEQGWHYDTDGRHWCPDCWEELP
jgi:hypothetical protein